MGTVPKTVIHIFHADQDSLAGGAHVAERVRQVAADRGIQLEVYLFGPAEHALLDAANTDFNSQIDALIEHGVPVRTCLNIAAATGAADQLAQRGIQLEFARDAFARYGQEAAAVISF
ncbi:DsrE family protein [Streptomyces canus]|uniref:hypothetical protein n=1 Tax=Streptomyces canus TaxID=58343 RepID=UPI0022519391|nr:hypothetical protein [Streptomyces canus]MCX4859049.1 DsrE family protein [Streptomyces canus]WSW35729.1 DsrE family protein [Streptomyces canus]